MFIFGLAGFFIPIFSVFCTLRPAGSQDVYYTESDTASIAESVTTVESTHTGKHFDKAAIAENAGRLWPNAHQR